MREKGDRAAPERVVAWRPFIVLVWLLVAMTLLGVVGFLRHAWGQIHPQLIPWSDTGPIDMHSDDLMVFFAFTEMLVLLALLPVAVATFATGIISFGPGRRRRAAILLAVALLTLVALPWWLVTDQSGDNSEPYEPGPAYWLSAASVLLVALVSLLLIAYGLVRPRAERRPEPSMPVPAGWYPDPFGAGIWRWWDGSSWAREASRAP